MSDRTKTSTLDAETAGSQSGLTVAPRQVRQTFMDFNLVLDLEHLDADIVILGLPYGDPYSIDQVTNDQTNGPTAIRQASRRSSGGLERWDFDLGGPLLNEKPVRIVDCRDVPGDARDLRRHYVNEITAITAVNLILNMIGKTIRAGYFDPR